MSETITGHCNCNTHKFTIPKPNDETKMNLCRESTLPLFSNMCESSPLTNPDCTDCRRWAGALHSAHIITPRKDIKVEGPEPRTHDVVGVDGNTMTRAWCDTCGSYVSISLALALSSALATSHLPAQISRPGLTRRSGLWIRNTSKDPSGMFLKAGLFDPQTLPKPTMETFMNSTEMWEKSTEGVQTFEKNQNVL